MKKLKWRISSLALFLILSCSKKDNLREISGTYEFNVAGKHSFVINANHIKATIRIVGANGGETIIMEDIPLDKNVEYTAMIGGYKNKKVFNNLKTELLNNLVTEYEVDAGNSRQFNNGMIRIDWVGFD
ncbi:MAG: hypothetical protein DSY82_08515 [Flavobacteriia bacterium]|nr:MAG: hypothetical protein DSY82_08515 [Flavobacteriia bacterium]